LLHRWVANADFKSLEQFQREVPHPSSPTHWASNAPADLLCFGILFLISLDDSKT